MIHLSLLSFTISRVRCGDNIRILSEELDRATFVNAQHWIESVRIERGNDVIMALVGNKSDLAAQRWGSRIVVLPPDPVLRQVTVEEGEAKAREHQMLFIETSAMANVNIKALFKKVHSASVELECLTVRRSHKRCQKWTQLAQRRPLREEVRCSVL